MADPKQNLIPNDPQLKDLLDLMKKDIFLSFSSHHIGTVQSFDASTQTATATINYKKTYYNLDPVTGLTTPVLVDYPVLIDCPVICLGGGLGSLTFPITKGDECLIVFNDRDMDNWFQGNPNGACATLRLHSFSDGIILVGLRSLGKKLLNYDTVRAILKAGTASVGVNPDTDQVLIENNLYTLNELLQELLTELGNLTTQIAAITVTAVTPGMGVSGPPVNAVAIAAIGTQINATAVKIGELLE